MGTDLERGLFWGGDLQAFGACAAAVVTAVDVRP